MKGFTLNGMNFLFLNEQSAGSKRVEPAVKRHIVPKGLLIVCIESYSAINRHSLFYQTPRRSKNGRKQFGLPENSIS